MSFPGTTKHENIFGMGDVDVRHTSLKRADEGGPYISHETIFDGFAKSPLYPVTVIPAKAGIQSFQVVADHLDSSRTRSWIYRSDDFLRVYHFLSFIFSTHDSRLFLITQHSKPKTFFTVYCLLFYINLREQRYRVKACSLIKPAHYIHILNRLS